MINVFFSSTLVLIGCLAPGWVLSQPEYARKYATPPNGLSYFLESAPDHQQVLVRELSPWAGPGEFTLLRLDSLGDPVANQRVGLTDTRAFLSPADIHIDPATGDQVISGWAQSDVILGDSFAAMAVKLDDLYQLTWANAIHADSATARFTHLIAFTPATYLAVGGVLDESSAHTDENFFIAKLNRVSGLLGDAVAFGGQGGDLARRCMYLPQQQQVIVVGETQSFGTQHHGVYIMALDTGLNKLWSQVFDGPATDIPYGVAWVNGELVLSGWASGWGGATYEAFIARLSLTGTLLDYRTIALSGQGIMPASVSMVPGGNLVIGGWGYPPLGNFLLETDLQGQVQWAYSYPQGQYGLLANVQPEDKRIFMAEEVPDGQGGYETVVWALGSDGTYGNGACNTPLTGWVATQRQPTVITPGNDVMPVAASDKLFTPWIQPEAMSWEPFCSGALGTPEATVQGIRLSPNPAADQVQIDWPQPLHGDAELRLIDALGRTVLHETIPEGTTDLRVKLSDLHTGTYHVVIVAEGKVIVDRLSHIR